MLWIVFSHVGFCHFLKLYYIKASPMVPRMMSRAENGGEERERDEIISSLH